MPPRLPPWLKRALGLQRPKKRKPPLPDNPYRRFYTKNRSFEELTRPFFPPKPPKK